MSFSPEKRSWFSRFLRPSDRHQPRSVRPLLEALEDRFLPTVDFFGGPTIPHVEANTLFVGQEWQSSSLSGLAGGLNSYLQTLVNSPYMDMLAQYNVGRGGFGSSRIEWYNNDPNMHSPMDDNDRSYPNGQTELQYLLVSAIQQGNYPPLDPNQLYVIFLPPGEQLKAPGGQMNNKPGGFYGYHNSFNSQYGRINYAVLPFPGDSNPTVPGISPFDSLTEATSHELSEAVTDPVGGTGWYDRQNNGEIGDIVNLQYVYWNGYVVQKEANQQDQGMVPSLPSANVAVTATANQMFNGPVMNFTDHSTTVFGDTAAQSLGGSPLPGSSFSVTIDWGDGQSSDGQVVYNGNGQYSVVGSHSYSQVRLVSNRRVADGPVGHDRIDEQHRDRRARPTTASPTRRRQ